MNRTDEASLAWRLADSASALLGAGDRAWFCVKIGAGDQTDAIVALLQCHARANTVLPSELVASVQVWVRGHVGSDREAILRHLVDRICV